MGHTLFLITTSLSLFLLIGHSLSLPAAREDAEAAADALRRLDLVAWKNQAGQSQQAEKRQINNFLNQTCIQDPFLQAMNDPDINDDAKAFCSSFIRIPLATATAFATAKTFADYTLFDS